MNCIIISSYGLQRRDVASRRIHALCSSLVHSHHPTLFVTWNYNYPAEELNDVSFIDRIVQLPLQPHRMLNRFSRAGRDVAGEHEKDPGIVTKVRRLVLTVAKKYLKNYVLHNYDSVHCSLNKEYMKISADVALSYLFRNSTFNEYIGNTDTLVLTSAGPAALHRIGSVIKRKYPHVYWVADYRDLMEFNEYLGIRNPGKMKRVDMAVFNHSDLITTISSGLGDDLCATARLYGKDIQKRIHVMYNGLYVDRNKRTHSTRRVSDTSEANIHSLRILYTGGLYTLRKMDVLVKALSHSSLMEKYILQYAGNSTSTVDALIQEHSAEKFVENMGYVNKDKVTELQERADILLLLKSPHDEKGVFTGKFFEYLQYEKPILVLGNRDQEFNKVCGEIGGIDILSYEEDAIRDYLESLYARWPSDIRRNQSRLEQFDWNVIVETMLRRVSTERGMGSE